MLASVNWLLQQQKNKKQQKENTSVVFFGIKRILVSESWQGDYYAFCKVCLCIINTWFCKGWNGISLGKVASRPRQECESSICDGKNQEHRAPWIGHQNLCSCQAECSYFPFACFFFPSTLPNPTPHHSSTFSPTLIPFSPCQRLAVMQCSCWHF